MSDLCLELEDVIKEFFLVSNAYVSNNFNYNFLQDPALDFTILNILKDAYELINSRENLNFNHSNLLHSHQKSYPISGERKSEISKHKKFTNVHQVDS
jgi:hypothetical protein